MEDGIKYELKGVVDGYIIEINELLITNPTYLQNYPETKGFLAFINPFGNDKKMKEKLLP
jgi:glycine cleavage system H lipoate-binding protein